jgi:hypothetical protein
MTEYNAYFITERVNSCSDPAIDHSSLSIRKEIVQFVEHRYQCSSSMLLHSVSWRQPYKALTTVMCTPTDNILIGSGCSGQYSGSILCYPKWIQNKYIYSFNNTTASGCINTESRKHWNLFSLRFLLISGKEPYTLNTTIIVCLDTHHKEKNFLY